MNTADLREQATRLVMLRGSLVTEQPFLGRLLMHLPLSFDESCNTAYTDMRQIAFNPAFAQRLSDDELRFVLLHECLHCVLKHCTRGRGLMQFLYNVACDIVVNSIIMGAIGVDRFTIDGTTVMHRTPQGDEGRKYSAEEVYRMMLTYGKNYKGDCGFDSHDVWTQLRETAEALEAVWNEHVHRASTGIGAGSGIPNGLNRLVAQSRFHSKIGWKQMLQDFIRFRTYDYLYTRPDRRFSDGGIVMPSFCEDVQEGQAEQLWFVVDTSGSVSDTALGEAMNEIEDAIYQVGGIEGSLSFFDSEVSVPIPFDSVESLKQIKPVGGGGTSFDAIFEAMGHFFEEELPRAVIIITDGCALFPEETVAREVPVFWIIVDSNRTAPWGECVHITTEEAI